MMFILALIHLCWLQCAFSSTTQSKQKADTDYDVIIMGAGMAGIAAAETLYNAGFEKFLIIEAQDYIGGRMKTVQFGNYTLNGGASWLSCSCRTFYTAPQLCAYDGIVPTKVNPMMTLAAKYGISYTYANWLSTETFEFNKKPPQSVNTTEYRKAYNKWSRVQECIDGLRRNLTNNYTDYDYKRDVSEYTALLHCGWQPPFSDYEKTIEFYEWDFEISDSTHDSSMIFDEFRPYELYGSEDQFVTDPRGYHGIFMGIAGEFLDLNNLESDPRIMLNSPITHVKYRNKDVRVTIENGTTYSARYGIVTFSLGVLQSDIVKYVPAFPAWKVHAINSMVMADYAAMYIQWPYDFWTPLNMTTEQFLFSDPRMGYFTWAYNLNNKNFFPGSNIWRFDIADYDARRVQQNVDDANTVREIVHSKLSYYFETIPEPTDFYVSRWHTNKYVQGSYSNWVLMFDFVQWKRLGYPLDQALFFAGEATAVDTGFVQGSYEDGIKVAQQILACEGVPVDNPEITCPPAHPTGLF